MSNSNVSRKGKNASHKRRNKNGLGNIFEWDNFDSEGGTNVGLNRGTNLAFGESTNLNRGTNFNFNLIKTG